MTNKKKFDKYPLLTPGVGNKKFNFQDFCKVAELMKDKAHLTDSPPLLGGNHPVGDSGLEQIRKIKAGMNTGRDQNSP